MMSFTPISFKCVTMTSTSSSRTWSKLVWWSSSEIDKFLTSWNRSHMLQLFAQVVPKGLSELSHLMVLFLPRSSLHISHHYALYQIARRTATSFSEHFIASISAISTLYRVILRALSVFASYLKICFKCMSQKCATISNSLVFPHSRLLSHGLSKVSLGSLKSTKFSFSGIVFSALSLLKSFQSSQWASLFSELTWSLIAKTRKITKNYSMIWAWSRSCHCCSTFCSHPEFTDMFMWIIKIQMFWL